MFSGHQRVKVKIGFLQASVNRFEVICIQMALDLIIKIPDTPLLVSTQDSFSPEAKPYTEKILVPIPQCWLISMLTFQTIPIL